MADVTCAAGQVAEVARALTENPRVASVHLASGTWDLFALVVAQDLATMSALLVDDLAPTPGVHSTRVRPIMELFSGAHWRLGAIGVSAAHELSAGHPEHQGRQAVREPDAFDKALYQALPVDGRMSLRDLAKRPGRSEPAVKRRLGHLTRTGTLTSVPTSSGSPAAGTCTSRSPCGCPTNCSTRRAGTSADGRRPGFVPPWPGRRTCSSPRNCTTSRHGNH